MVPIPALDSRPVLTELQAVYLKEFFLLSAGRSSNGFGLNPLPYVEIVAFLLLGISEIPDTPAEYAETMRTLDNLYLRVKHEKEKKKDTNKPVSTPSKPPPKKR